MRRALLVLLLAAIPVAALADQDTKAKAQQHTLRASEAYDQGRFTEALNELTLAYALDPDPELLYAMGQIHVKLGQCSEAIAFYKRFLASKPAADEAAVAKKAIRICETEPQTINAPKPEPTKPDTGNAPPAPEPPTPEPAQPPPPPEPQIVMTTAPWYTDVVGDALVGAGVVVGITGLVLHRSALSMREDADRAATYEQHEQLVADAKSRQTLAVVVTVGGGALLVAGLVHYFVADRTEQQRIDVAPTADGGVVSWSGRF